ncbi:MAG TPA: glycosyltransferase family 4 protein [Chthoniobacterales bacterium]
MPRSGGGLLSSELSHSGRSRILVHDYGGYSFPLELSRELARRGHEVCHVFVNFLATARADFEKTADDPPQLSIRAVHMSPHYDKRKYVFYLRFWMNLQYAARLLREVASQKPDLVLSGNAPTEIQLPLCLFCSIRGISFANWVQDFFSVAVKRLLSSKQKLLGAIVGNLYEAADRWVVTRSAVSILISGEFSKVIEGWGVDQSPCAVIPNWAPVEKCPTGPKQNWWSESQGLSSKFVFLYSGTLGLKHNPSHFLALAKEFESDANVQIVVVAEGAGAEWIKEQLLLEKRSNLRVLPYQSAAELPQVLATGDVLMAVLENDASHFSVPSKILTYLCAARSILLAVPTQNLASQIVIQNQMGLVSDPDDAASFIKNARSLYRDPSLREEMALRARRYAEENFRIEKVADKFERALQLAPAVVDRS